MRKSNLGTAIILSVLLSVFVTSAYAVGSLRGEYDLDKESKTFEKKKQIKNKGFDRNYTLQPPLIPHSIEKDKVTLKGNTCMKCHSAKNFQKEKAPKAGDSHYLDRDGKVLSKISSRRYFCMQCHVPQLDAQPLVDNNF
ncbi:MAG: nitrate reductase cytochrome c-type subunit [Gammaproteobacteria bacterium]|nr:nitrate reductase cytochrome c-type subunit [Gammaproteobacteria bacterium]